MSMKLHRINALIIRHLYLYQRSLPRIMDLFYWPVMELLLWGFLSMYLAKFNIGGLNAVTVLLGAIIFWDLFSQSQKAVSISFLEEVWERNFLNIFVTPLRVSEFLASTFLLGVIRIIAVSVIMGLLAFLFYHFNFFLFGFALIPFMANLLLFGFSIGLFTNAIILRYGTSAQILAFGLIMLIQPFSAVFYPVSVLPAFLQPLSYIFPSTFVFEGMRTVLATGTLPAHLLFGALFTNALYLILMVWFFYRMFAYVKRAGRLLKLD